MRYADATSSFSITSSPRPCSQHERPGDNDQNSYRNNTRHIKIYVNHRKLHEASTHDHLHRPFVACRSSLHRLVTPPREQMKVIPKQQQVRRQRQEKDYTSEAITQGMLTPLPAPPPSHSWPVLTRAAGHQASSPPRRAPLSRSETRDMETHTNHPLKAKPRAIPSLTTDNSLAGREEPRTSGHRRDVEAP